MLKFYQLLCYKNSCAVMLHMKIMHYVLFGANDIACGHPSCRTLFSKDCESFT